MCDKFMTRMFSGKSSMRAFVLLIAGVCLLTAAGPASADRVDFYVFENSTSGDVSGLDLWVDVLDVVAGKVDLVFHNDGIASAVEQINPEDTPWAQANLANGAIVDESPPKSVGPPVTGVDFEPKSGASNLPGGTNISWLGELENTSFDAQSPPPKLGLNPGETLTLRYDLLVAGASASDVVSALQGDGWRIGQHVISVGPQEFSVSTVTTVPLPAAAWAGLLLMGGIGANRMRRRLRS